MDLRSLMNPSADSNGLSQQRHPHPQPQPHPYHPHSASPSAVASPGGPPPISTPTSATAVLQTPLGNQQQHFFPPPNPSHPQLLHSPLQTQHSPPIPQLRRQRTSVSLSSSPLASRGSPEAVVHQHPGIGSERTGGVPGSHRSSIHSLTINNKEAPPPPGPQQGTTPVTPAAAAGGSPVLAGYQAQYQMLLQQQQQQQPGQQAFGLQAQQFQQQQQTQAPQSQFSSPRSSSHNSLPPQTPQQPPPSHYQQSQPQPPTPTQHPNQQHSQYYQQQPPTPHPPPSRSHSIATPSPVTAPNMPAAAATTTVTATASVAPPRSRTTSTAAPSPRVPPKLLSKRYRPVPIWAQKDEEDEEGFKPKGMRGGEHQPGTAAARPADDAGGPPPQEQYPDGAGPPPPVPPHPPEEAETYLLGDGATPSHWEPTLTNNVPYDEVTRAVADFVFNAAVLSELPPGFVEIEGKLGMLVERDAPKAVGGQGLEGWRLQLPVGTETVLRDMGGGVGGGFRSSMTTAQHATMNKFLNTETALSQQPSRHKIHYTHPKERDAFFLLPPHFALPPWAAHFVAERGRGPKLRVTTDLKTGRVKACIVKIRVADLNVYSPLTPFDWRVSVNIELPLSPADFLSNGSGPPPSQEAPSEEQEQQFLAQLEPDQDAQVRVKDRMQYRHLIYTVDLTQVTLPDGAKVHECEIEADAERVLREADRARRGEGNEFERAVGGLVANLRVMCRAGGY